MASVTVAPRKSMLSIHPCIGLVYRARRRVVLRIVAVNIASGRKS